VSRRRRSRGGESAAGATGAGAVRSERLSMVEGAGCESWRRLWPVMEKFVL